MKKAQILPDLRFKAPVRMMMSVVYIGVKHCARIQKNANILFIIQHLRNAALKLKLRKGFAGLAKITYLGQNGVAKVGTFVLS